jgi:hypothetical protein
MKTSAIALGVLLGSLLTVNDVNAQTTGEAWPKIAAWPRIDGPNPSGNGVTRKKVSDKKKEREKKMNADYQCYLDTQKKFNNYNADQKKLQGSHYLEGKFYDTNFGARRDDITFNKLQQEMDRAERQYKSSKSLYDDEP